MDERSAPSGQSDNRDFFKPEGVVTSDGVAAASTAATPANPPIEPSPPPAPPAAPRDVKVSATNAGAVNWTASEFIAHHKSFGWYAVLGGVAAVLAAGLWFLTKDTFSAGVVLVGALLLGIYAAHKPRQLAYSLDDHGLVIGQRHYAFSEFRSFSVVPEGAFASIELLPLKRFAMFTTIYFDPADEDKIVAVLSAHLPMEESKGDAVDQLMRRIRF